MIWIQIEYPPIARNDRGEALVGILMQRLCNAPLILNLGILGNAGDRQHTCHPLRLLDDHVGARSSNHQQQARGCRPAGAAAASLAV